ncbi:MAG: hypothetical protein J3R72DRAFT_471426 [Linnemannia gamsii]|nr:MAG: hypothetical protein J3R72DRAFT_471426 [Linnemannia gamsii]
MAILTFSANSREVSRQSLSRRQNVLSVSGIQAGGQGRSNQQSTESITGTGSGSSEASESAEWELHELDGPSDPSNDGVKPSGRNSFFSRMKRRRVLRLGFMGLLTALSMFALWTRYPSHRTGLSTETLESADEDYWTHDPDKTILPTRTYAPDEKYLILEYSPWLGFNNMRYMIERGLYLSRLLNRTLVLPTDLRIRSCSDFNICAQAATYLTPGSANSRNEQESIFALDLGYFFDLPHLAERTGERQIVLKTVQRKSWDLAEDPTRTLIDNIIRNGLVDTLHEKDGDHSSKQAQEDGSVLVNRSFYAFADVQGGGVGRIVSWSVQFQFPPMSDSNKQQDPSQTTSRSNKGHPLLETCRPPLEDPAADQIPWESRFPGFATCRIENYVGLADELGPIDADVLVIEGQFHTTGWIPLAYSSLENAHNHRRMALTYLTYSPSVHEAADYLMASLRAKIQRRQPQGKGRGALGNDDANPSDYSWLRLSMHVRRGDFVSQKHGWQKFDDTWMGSLVKEAVESVFGPIDTTLDITSTTPVSNDEPGIDAPQDTNQQQPGPHQQIQIPQFGFYMSTDESSPQILDYFQSLGAILFEDLLDNRFESRFGHLIVFDDWIGLVEQLICARAGMFYGTMSSSFSSGILNLRMEGETVDGGEGRLFGYLYKPGGPVLTPVQQQQG